MIIRKAFLILTCWWELIRLFLVTAIIISVINVRGDLMIVILFFLMNAGNIVVPLYVLHERNNEGNSAGLFYYRTVKIWTVCWEGILVLLISSFGAVLLGLLEYSTGSGIVYRIAAGGLLSKLPVLPWFVIFFVDLIFLSGILLLKPEPPDNIDTNGKSTDGSGKGPLPRAEVIRIEEDT